MVCFVCKKQVVPENCYFKSQLFGDKVICHVQCQPKFYYDNKPQEKESTQQELWREQE